MIKYLIYLSIIFLFGCSFHSTLPISGNTVANQILQREVQETIIKYLKYKQCKEIHSIRSKNITTSDNYIEELWHINACDHNYHTIVSYSKYFTNRHTHYQVTQLIEDKKKKYHAKIYTLNEYIKKLPSFDKKEILFKKESLFYLRTKTLPKESIDKEIRKVKSLSLIIKYDTFQNIVNDKIFFNKYPIEKLSSYELETVIYTKKRALVTFSSTGDYSFFRGYYLLELNQNKITIFSLGSDIGCGTPIEMPYIKSKGDFISVP